MPPPCLSALLGLVHPHSPSSHIAQLHAHLVTLGLLSTTFALNTLIRAYNSPTSSFQLFRQLLLHDPALALVPDNYTFTFLLPSCAHLSSLSALHSLALRLAFSSSDPHFQSRLLHSYATHGCPDSALLLYSELPRPDTVTQTALLSALARCGRIHSARQLFDDMPLRDTVSWSAIIAGYSQAGRPREALEMFLNMQTERVRVNSATMVSVFTACAHLGALELGKWAHAYVKRSKMCVTVAMGTAIIDMYAKCGDMERAMQVFGEMGERNAYTWSCAMNGMAMNGFGIRCLQLFQQLKEENMEPSGVIFIAVLRGCSVAGLVDEGRAHFDSMKTCYGIEPLEEHYGLMVDLYGRAGRLDDALSVINSMPLKPHAGAWGALLNACRIYRNVKMGELAMRKIVELEAWNDGAYVQLSNIYADSRNWKRVTSVRAVMKGRGVSKEPGCSAIEVAGEVYEFFVGDRSHPRYKEIEAMLAEMSRRLRLAGYFAKTKEVLFDIEDEEKEDALRWHSEKLAIAFGLVALEEGATIRIVKNLRICWDCHDAAKLLSKAFEREIVARDRNRFHHFRNGMCSCKDYW